MIQFFSPDYQYGKFQVFSVSHLLALLVVVIINLGIVLWLRNHRSEKLKTFFRHTIAILLILQEISREFWYIYTGNFSLGRSLPLHLCGLSIIFGVIMLISKKHLFFEFVYFWGLGGGIQALLTPDFVNGFPHFIFFLFFVAHGLIVLSCLYMAVVERFKPTWKSVIKVIVVTNIYMVFIGIFNHFTGGNYMFLCRKPPNPSIIDLLGPWPWYILSLEGIGIVSIILLYLPFLKNDLKKRTETQPDAGQNT